MLNIARKFLIILNNLLHKKSNSKNIREANGILIGNKITGKITEVSRSFLKSSLDPAKGEAGNINFDKEIQKKDVYHLKKGNKLLMSLD